MANPDHLLCVRHPHRRRCSAVSPTRLPVDALASRPRGRVVLIGDAAHSMTPHLASGAGMAIEDGIVLAEELAADGAVPEALERFMDRRWERCRMVVENSMQISEWERAPEGAGGDAAAL